MTPSVTPGARRARDASSGRAGIDAREAVEPFTVSNANATSDAAVEPSANATSDAAVKSSATATSDTNANVRLSATATSDATANVPRERDVGRERERPATMTSSATA